MRRQWSRWHRIRRNEGKFEKNLGRKWIKQIGQRGIWSKSWNNVLRLWIGLGDFEDVIGVVDGLYCFYELLGSIWEIENGKKQKKSWRDQKEQNSEQDIFAPNFTFSDDISFGNDLLSYKVRTPTAHLIWVTKEKHICRIQFKKYSGGRFRNRKVGSVPSSFFALQNTGLARLLPFRILSTL